MSYDLQPDGRFQPPSVSPSQDVQSCPYCGAPLSEFYYFCLACATPYKNVDTVVTPARPRQLTDEELIAKKAPQVATLFWTYFAVIFGVGILSYVLFREDRPDLQLLLNELGIMATTFVFGWIHRRSLAVQFKTFGFNKPAAYVGLVALIPLLLINFGYHELLKRLLEIDSEDFLGRLRAASISEWVLVATFCVTPGIFEEIAFRGLIQHWLQTAVKSWKAVVLASFLFAIMHFSVLSFPYLFLVGGLLGWVKLRTGSLFPSMLIHFLHNLVVIEWFS